MIDKRKKDKFGNGLIAFLFICIIFLLCYAFKNPILLYSSNPEVEINHEYDPKKNIQQVFFHLDSDVKISGNININKIGNYEITYQLKNYKKTCKVSVKNAKKGTVIYNFAKSTNPDNHPPYKADYSEFKYNLFRIWLCDATFWGEKTFISPDYRGRKLKISLKVKNSGKRTLPEMGVCFNYTKGGDTGAYPWALHVSAKKLSAKVKKDKTHKHCKFVTKAMKKGKSYTFNFTFTIPKNAINGDTDKDTGANYPIMMYIPNMKDTSPYKEGDSITVQKCVIKVA